MNPFPAARRRPPTDKPELLLQIPLCHGFRFRGPRRRSSFGWRGYIGRRHSVSPRLFPRSHAGRGGSAGPGCPQKLQRFRRARVAAARRGAVRVQTRDVQRHCLGFERNNTLRWCRADAPCLRSAGRGLRRRLQPALCPATPVSCQTLFSRFRMGLWPPLRQVSRRSSGPAVQSVTSRLSRWSMRPGMAMGDAEDRVGCAPSVVPGSSVFPARQPLRPHEVPPAIRAGRAANQRSRI